MAITIGLREVQLMLDKDEAFMLVTLRKAKRPLYGSYYPYERCAGYF